MDITSLGVEFDQSVNTLYFRVKPGTVARTVEVSPLILVDVDENDVTLGVEFVNADEFLPYLRAHDGVLPSVKVWPLPHQRAAG